MPLRPPSPSPRWVPSSPTPSNQSRLSPRRSPTPPLGPSPGSRSNKAPPPLSPPVVSPLTPPTLSPTTLFNPQPLIPTSNLPASPPTLPRLLNKTSIKTQDSPNRTQPLLLLSNKLPPNPLLLPPNPLLLPTSPLLPPTSPHPISRPLLLPLPPTNLRRPRPQRRLQC